MKQTRPVPTMKVVRLTKEELRMITTALEAAVKNDDRIVRQLTDRGSKAANAVVEDIGKMQTLGGRLFDVLEAFDVPR